MSASYGSFFHFHFGGGVLQLATLVRLLLMVGESNFGGGVSQLATHIRLLLMEIVTTIATPMPMVYVYLYWTYDD
jgi:hypothetical protein